MIEYLYNAIRATAGEDIVISAEITEDSGECIAADCALMLWDNDKLITAADGKLSNNVWYFTIPADATTGLIGRYWYCICHKNSKLQFKQPIYLV